MYQVKFSFEQKERAPVVVQEVESGQTLLQVALQHNIELPHDCGGICHCTVCHVYVVKGAQYLDEQGLREQHFIKKKVANAQSHSRLSCQSVLLDGGGELEVLIPEAAKGF